MGNQLFQHNTLGVLMTGLFDGSLTIEKLLLQGSIGIGTLDGLDGELIVLDGKAYQVKADGSCHQVKGHHLTPYAVVTAFEPENLLEITSEQSRKSFEQIMTRYFSSINTFQAIKLKGTFKVITCRSIKKQEKPYPRLVEVSRKQTVFTKETVEGTLVGFYTPELFGSIAAEGFHLHFLSDKKDFGGHVLDFIVENGTVEWQTMETLEQHFPIENQTFMESDIDYGNLLDEIEEAER